MGILGLEITFSGIFFVYLRKYFEFWVMFSRIDPSEEKLITLDKFKKAKTLLKNWGLDLGTKKKELNKRLEDEFKEMDIKKEGQVAYYDFCKYALKKKLDLEDDDGWYDPELERMK